MDDRVADVEFAQVLDQRLDVADLFLLLAPACRGAGREQFGFGDEIDAGLDPGKTGVERRGCNAQRLVAAFKLGQRFEGGRRQLAGVQEVEQAGLASFALGQHQHAMLAVPDMVFQPCERIVSTAHHRQPVELLELGVVRHIGNGRSDGELRMLVDPRVERFGRQKQRIRGQGGALGVALHQAVALARVLPEMLEGALQVAVQHDRGFIAKVIENGGGLFEEQRQVVLDAGRGHAVADVLVDAAARRVALQQFAPAAAKARARRVVHREFTTRQQADLGHRVQAALAVGVEGADAVDLVVEQVDAIRHAAAHREQVDQRAAHGVFAGADDLAHVAVAGQRQLRLEPGFVELLLELEMEGVGRQEAGRRQPVERGGGGHDDDVGAAVLVALADAPQGRQTLADQVLVR